MMEEKIKQVLSTVVHPETGKDIVASGFIEHTAAADGKVTVVLRFAKTRDPQYTYNDLQSFRDNVWWQRRVELWGEGHAYTDIMRLKKNLVRCTTDGKSDFPDAWAFDIKRFEKGITRSYAGTNHPKGYRWNTDGVPDWMNLCIVGTEVNFNQACTNNPTPIQPTEDSPEKVW